jgi:hypothetical protein
MYVLRRALRFGFLIIRLYVSLESLLGITTQPMSPLDLPKEP